MTRMTASDEPYSLVQTSPALKSTHMKFDVNKLRVKKKLTVRAQECISVRS